MQSCAIELRQRLFRCSHLKKIPNSVSETRGNRSPEYFVTESWGAPGKQCDQIWRNFATLGKGNKSLGKILTVYFLLG